MYIQRHKWKSKNGKIYETVYLRESYRDGGKVKKREIANLTHCSEEEIKAIELAIKHKGNLNMLGSLSEVHLSQGPSIGALWVVREMIKRLRIADALGENFEGKLAAWLIFARLLDQGSRLSATRLARSHAVSQTLGIHHEFNEYHLYKTLSWLSSEQENVEKKLFYSRHEGKIEFVLYDVTSSYLEGKQNEYAAFGYNRDKKRGKKQIVIGLLCDDLGAPISTEVFRGNTQDLATVRNQIDKAVNVFGCKQVTFIGDRGMIKSPQIQDLSEVDFHYITAITRAQIQSLIKKGALEIGLFDNELAEIEHEGNRYILRRNPLREKEISANRRDKLESLLRIVENKNEYLREHPRAKEETAIKEIKAFATKLKIDSWIEISVDSRRISIDQNEEILREVSLLDGCYVIKTDIEQTQSETEEVHDRYKDLTDVEKAFRDSKTVHLELRPIYLRRGDRTRGHVLVVMLSYMIVRELRRAWKDFDVTVEEGLAELDKLCAISITTEGGGTCLRIPQPSREARKLLDALNIHLPNILPGSNVNVDTQRKLQNRRKTS